MASRPGPSATASAWSRVGATSTWPGSTRAAWAAPPTRTPTSPGSPGPDGSEALRPPPGGGGHLDAPAPSGRSGPSNPRAGPAENATAGPAGVHPGQPAVGDHVAVRGAGRVPTPGLAGRGEPPAVGDVPLA